MSRFLATLRTLLRETVLALIAQPSRPGATPEERAGKAAQAQRLRGAPAASAWDAVRQVGSELGKAALGQPTPRARRRENRSED